MKRGLLTRGLAIGIVCSMAFLCACGKKNEKVEADKIVPAAEIDREHIYTMDDMAMPFEGNYYVDGCCSSKDSFFAMVNFYDGDEGKKLFKMSYEDQEITEIPLDPKIWYDGLECDKEGNIYLLQSGYDAAMVEYADEAEDGEADDAEESGDIVEGFVSEDGSSGITKAIAVETDGEEEASDEVADQDVVADDSGAGQDDDNVVTYSDEEAVSNKLVKLSPSGEKLWEASLTKEDAKSYVQGMKYVEGKGILTNCNGEFSLYDENTGEGKSLFSRHEESSDDYYYSTLYRMKSGDVYLCEDAWSSDGNTTITKFNKDTLKFDEEVTLPDGVYGGDSLQPGHAYDFYVNDSSEIRAFNLGDEKATLICDFTASDILVNYINYICDTPDGQLMVVMNEENGANTMSLLTKVDPNEVSEKETLTIGTIFVPNSIRQQVVKFNKSSDKYRIKIVDYADDEYEDNENTYMDAANKIGLDLVQGQAPDLLVIDDNMPAESYAQKGALEPLDPYFEADQELNISDFLENVIEATKVDNKIYTLVPSFNVETCVAAKDIVGDEKVTLENYKDVCKNNGIDPEIGMGLWTATYANQLYSTVGTQYIDYANGTCSFNSQGFIDLLKFINDLPSEDEAMDIDYEETESYYRENKALLYQYYISSFEDYQVLKKGYFGRDIVFNGFPTANGGESFIRPYVQIAMNSDCKHKDAAWEFMRSFMTDDFQKNIEWSFPVKKTALDAMAKKAQEKPYYIDANGKKVVTESTWSVGGVDVKIEELSEEETKQLTDFITSVTNTALYEEKIINIISEEAAAYYEGQKTAEEVADIIQSRVSIYMSENM